MMRFPPWRDCRRNHGERCILTTQLISKIPVHAMSRRGMKLSPLNSSDVTMAFKELRYKVGPRLRELAPAARGEITQPMARLIADLCIPPKW